MVAVPDDVDGLETQLSRLEAFAHVAALLWDHDIGSRDERFTECCVYVLDEMKNATQAALKAFYGVEAPPS